MLLWFCLNLQQSTTQLLSHSFPLPSGMGRRIRRIKAKTRGLGWEQFNRMAKGEENNNNTDKKHIQRAGFSPPDAQLAPEQQKPLLQPALHFNTEHGITWYRISHLLGCLGQPNQLLVKVNSVPAESRTDTQPITETRAISSSALLPSHLCYLLCF